MKLKPTALVALVLASLSVVHAQTSPFLADCAAQAEVAAKAGKQTIAGTDAWLFFAPELRHLGAGKFWGADAAKVSRATKPEYADPLPAILDFKQQLDKAGIELILAPVPAKAVVFPGQASKVPRAAVEPPPRQDTVHQVFFDELQKAGVKVLDLAPALLAARHGERGPSFCKTDTHWSGAGCVAAAQAIAKEVKGRGWFAGVTKGEFKTEWKKMEITGDLASEAGAGKESLELRFVSQAGAPVEPDRASPLLLLGDSHNLIFHAGDDMHTKGAGLPDQLAAELGFVPDLVAVRGSGATPARINLLRRVRDDGNYLAGKKLVVWCFTVREFTESAGWQKVPVVK